VEALSSKGGARVPRPVLTFLLKALAIFVIWKVLYLTLLLPHLIPDRALTRFVGVSTVSVLNLFTPQSPYRAVEINDDYTDDGVFYRATCIDVRRGGLQTLRVANPCNGLELMVLYIAFLYCFPAPWRRRLVFLVGGCLLITLLNVLRCAALVVIFERYKAYLDFSHHFIFTFVIYCLIFILWFFFTKNLSLHKNPPFHVRKPSASQG
jgi:exosortase family protein XrtF